MGFDDKCVKDGCINFKPCKEDEYGICYEDPNTKEGYQIYSGLFPFPVDYIDYDSCTKNNDDTCSQGCVFNVVNDVQVMCLRNYPSSLVDPSMCDAGLS